MSSSTEEERKEVADRIKTQLMMNNYGLPENAEAIGLGQDRIPGSSAPH